MLISSSGATPIVTSTTESITESNVESTSAGSSTIDMAEEEIGGSAVSSGE